MMAADKQKQRQAERRAEAEKRSQLERGQGNYTPPDRGECDPFDTYMPVDDSATLRITTRIWRQSGRMTEFVLSLEVGDWSDSESWQELARIDCSGGTCHEHPVHRPDDHLTIHRLDTIDDVQRAYPAAIGRINEMARKIRDRRTT